MIETTVSQRRELTSERLLKESEDQRAEREVRQSTGWVILKDLGHTNRTTSLAERISNPKSRKPSVLSTVQCAISSFGTLLSMTNTATRMRTTTKSGSRRCNSTNGRRLIPRRRSKNGGKRNGRERRKNC